MIEAFVLMWIVDLVVVVPLVTFGAGLVRRGARWRRWAVLVWALVFALFAPGVTWLGTFAGVREYEWLIVLTGLWLLSIVATAMFAGLVAALGAAERVC